MAATKIKVIDLAKELGVTSKDLMLAAEEMGHKGVRAMTPLDATLANALRVKLGKGRELPPEEPKPKRVSKPRAPKTAATEAHADGTPAEEGGLVKKPSRARKAKTEPHEEAPAEVKPAATIVKPKPVEIAPEPPVVAPESHEETAAAPVAPPVEPTPSVVRPAATPPVPAPPTTPPAPPTTPAG